MVITSSFGTVTPAEMEKFRALIETRKEELKRAGKKSGSTGGKKCTRRTKKPVDR